MSLKVEAEKYPGAVLHPNSGHLINENVVLIKADRLEIEAVATRVCLSV